MDEGQLARIARKSVFDEPYQHFGRMDELSRVGLAAIAFALKDAGLDERTQRRDIGMIASTTFGCLHTDIDYYDTVMADNGKSASPALFSYTLPNCFMGETARCFGLTGSSYVINEVPPTGLASMHAAMDGIALGEFQRVVTGICDLGCPPHLHIRKKTIPGAVFLVIENHPESGLAPFGSLDLGLNGLISFNGKEIRDLNDLVIECLAVPL